MTKKELTGKRFGRLTVLASPFKTPRGLAVAVVCNCVGKEKTVLVKPMLKGTIRSCGCLRREVNELLSPTDAEGRIKYVPRREYAAYTSAKQRCLNPRANKYDQCGGAGITFHPEWLEDFPKFYKDLGRAEPGQILTRKDLKGNFVPGNCVWSTWREVGSNTKRQRLPLLAAAA